MPSSIDLSCRTLRAALCLGAASGLASAQISFQPMPLTTATPPASADNALLRDFGPGGELLAFVSLGASAETWAYANSAWTKLTLPVAPPPRAGFAVADGAIFGGRTAANALLNDTWMVYISGNVWTRVVSANSIYPPARADAAFCVGYGINILMGGRDANGVLGDCWRLKESTQPPYDWNWLPAPAGPSPRCDHRLANQPDTGHALLFGGRDANGNALADTWIFDGTAWTLATPQHKPPARSRHAMSIEFQRRRVVLFGGLDQNLQPMNDVWEWVGGDWVQRSPSTTPTARAGASLCFDDRIHRAALYGGGGKTDLWSYGTDFLPEIAKLGATCVFSEFGSAQLLAGSPQVAVIGGSIDLIASGFRPASPMLFMLGTSATTWGGYTLPLDLGPWIGGAGCKLYTSIDAAVPLVATLGFATLGLSVPNDMTFAGMNLYVQTLGDLRSFSSTYALGTTNALRLRIGAY